MARAKRTSAEPQLTRRERQIMDILFELGEAGVEDVRARLPEPPSYSAARALLAKMEAKGHVEHREKDLRYVYRPTRSRADARHGAVARLVRTFFDGSMSSAITGMLDMTADDLPDDELERLAARVERARRQRTGR